jgi:cyclopropane fatty-acyl-phospholipid synthase-like methyltransferase
MLPNASITAFSNSRTQKEYIDSVAREKGLSNLQVITGNIVNYEFQQSSFDRVVSIEVSSAMLSYEALKPIQLHTPGAASGWSKYSATDSP